MRLVMKPGKPISIRNYERGVLGASVLALLMQLGLLIDLVTNYWEKRLPNIPWQSAMGVLASISLW